MALYHTDIFLPSDLRLPSGVIRLRYGSHARQEAMKDRYGVIELPASLRVDGFKVIEVEVQKGKVIKVLYRGPLDNERDICIVVMPKDGFVKTVWINLKTDQHKTLKRWKYDTT